MIENVEYCDKFFTSRWMLLYQPGRVPVEYYSGSRARRRGYSTRSVPLYRAVEKYSLENKKDISALYLLYCFSNGPAFHSPRSIGVCRCKANISWLDKDGDVAQRRAKEPPWWLTVPRWKLNRALRKLPRGYREVFQKHERLGYTHKDIADSLGCSVGTSKSQLHKARRRLRQWLLSAAVAVGDKT